MGTEFWDPEVIHEEACAEEGKFKVRLLELGYCSGLECSEGKRLYMPAQTLALCVRNLI